MQLLIDFAPIVVFFVVYKLAGMYWATAAIIVAMAIQMAIQWLREGKVSKMLLISTALVALFGGITLLLRDPLFIQWKPTVVNWLFAAAFLGSGFIGAVPMKAAKGERAVSSGWPLTATTTSLTCRPRSENSCALRPGRTRKPPPATGMAEMAVPRSPALSPSARTDSGSEVMLAPG